MSEQVEVYVRIDGELLRLGAVDVPDDHSPRSAEQVSAALRVVADRITFRRLTGRRFGAVA